jgi:hypothetical protein
VGEELERALARLHDMGARIALDDAGAGYARLQQLMRVRPDIVKLDRSLVSYRDPGARVAVGDVPARAHALATGEAGQILRTDVDVDRAERRAMASAGYNGVLLVPLEAGGAIQGLVACYRRRARPWSRESVARVHARALPLAAALSGGGLTVAEGA